MAKVKGCKVIGTAGSEDKVKWLKEEIGFDHVINYKTCGDFEKALEEAAPGGIDLFYDNVSYTLLHFYIFAFLPAYCTYFKIFCKLNFNFYETK